MKLNLWKAIVVLFAAFAVLSAIQAAVSTVDISTIPTELQSWWLGIVYIFTSGVSTVIFTFLGNILGYAQNKLEASPETRSQIQYQSNLLAATWAQYALYIYGLTAAIQAFAAGTPYQQHATLIAGAISIVVVKITKAIDDLAKSNAQPITTIAATIGPTPP